GREDVDRRVVPGAGQGTLEHDVPVERGACQVGDGFIHVFAVDEHGVDGGDAAAGGGSCPLHQVRKHAEDGRRVTAGCRRFASVQTDFALGHRDAGKTVEQQQDVEALVAER